MALKTRGRYTLIGTVQMLGLLFGVGCYAALAQEGLTIGTSGEMISGQQQFRRYCAQCHGLDGTGNGPVAPALKKKPTNLTSLAKNHGGVFPDKEVRDYIDGQHMITSHGSREMPIWGREFMLRQASGAGAGGPPLTQSQVQRKIDLLANYIRSIQSK